MTNKIRNISIEENETIIITPISNLLEEIEIKLLKNGFSIQRLKT